MDILLIRQLLEQLLDYHYELYLSKLRDWFSHRISKHQFDKDLSSVLQGEVLQLHNQLLMAILAQSTSSPGGGPVMNYPVDGYGGEELQELELMESEGDTDEASSSSNEFEIVNVDENTYQGKLRVNLNRRFPSNFAKEFQAAHKGDYDLQVNVVPNVTHGILAVEENIRENSFYREVFKVRDPNQPVLTSGANLYGRFLVEAWKRQLDSVHPAALHFAIKACINHIKNIIIAMAKQRKSFRSRDGRYVHSIGAPYPNPYLLQGQHIFEDTYSSDTAKLAEVMQIPAFLPTQEERERLAALEVASSVPLKYPHLKTKATLVDLLDAIQTDRSLIPNALHRSRICELIFQQAKGYGETYNVYDEGKDLVPKTVYPIISY